MSQWENKSRRRDQDSFRGTVLVTTLCQEFPDKFSSRYSALKFTRNLFRQGSIKGLYGTSSFEDTDQLYAWGSNEPTQASWQLRKTNPNTAIYGYRGVTSSDVDDAHILGILKNKLTKKIAQDSDAKVLQVESFRRNRSLESRKPPNVIGSPDYVNQVELFTKREQSHAVSQYTNYNITQTFLKTKHPKNMASNDQPSSKDGEESFEKTSSDRLANSIEEEIVPKSLASETQHYEIRNTTVGIDIARDIPSEQWPSDSQYCYSDNEKQLIEEMGKMKSEHSEILQKYEERISKLMTRMHELKGIAEMLENTGPPKSTPYGVMPSRASMLNFIGKRS